MEKVISSKIVYECPIFRVEEAIVRLPDNSEAKRWYVMKDDAVFAICVKDEKILLIKEFRSAAKSYEWWVPSGGVENNENPKEAIVREIREETGLKPKNVVLIETFHSPSSIVKQKTHCFLATDFIEDPLESGEIEDKFIETSYLSIDEVKNLISGGEIRDNNILKGLRKIIAEKF